VFKKKRRKGYQKQNGHRQYMTQIQIDQIIDKVVAKAAPKAKAEPKADAPAAEANNEA